MLQQRSHCLFYASQIRLKGDLSAKLDISNCFLQVKHIPELSCVASASLDRTIVLVDPDRRTPPRSLGGHGKGFHSFAWSKT